MKTFKQFLQEANVKSWSAFNVLTDDAINLLNAHCKDGLKAIASDTILYRGDDSFNADFVSLDLSDMVRTSRDSNNVYQLMMDNSSALTEYPKRSNSMICATSVAIARNYQTNVYVIVPYDNTMIAVGQEDDFPETRFKSGIFNSTTLNDFSYGIGGHTYSAINPSFLFVFGIDSVNGKHVDIDYIDSELSKATPEEMFLATHVGLNLASFVGCNLTTDDLPDSYRNTFEMFTTKPTRDKLTSLSNLIKGMKLTGPQSRLLNFFKELPKNKRFSAMANELMTPESLDLSLVKYGSDIQRNKEVWFSGKAIAIKLEIFRDIQKQLGHQ
jgi:hypothetical protein